MAQREGGDYQAGREDMGLYPSIEEVESGDGGEQSQFTKSEPSLLLPV